MTIGHTRRPFLPFSSLRHVRRPQSLGQPDGALKQPFGRLRHVALFQMCDTLGGLSSPLAYNGLNVALLAIALLLRGGGGGAVGIPAMSAGYASIARAAISMATPALNIMQRIGRPTLITAYATFLGWRLAIVGPSHVASEVYAETFGLLTLFHGALLFATRLIKPAEKSHQSGPF